jgi:hypothetical protein
MCDLNIVGTHIEASISSSQNRVVTLLDLAFVEVETLCRPLLLYPFAGHWICPPGPFCDSHLLLFPEVFSVFCIDQGYLAFEHVLVYVWVALLI